MQTRRFIVGMLLACTCCSFLPSLTIFEAYMFGRDLPTQLIAVAITTLALQVFTVIASLSLRRKLGTIPIPLNRLVRMGMTVGWIGNLGCTVVLLPSPSSSVVLALSVTANLFVIWILSITEEKQKATKRLMRLLKFSIDEGPPEPSEN